MEEEVLRAGEAVINKRKQSFKRKENAVNIILISLTVFVDVAL